MNKQTVYVGIAILCIFVLAPAFIETTPVMSFLFMGIACACRKFGKLEEVNDDEV